MTEKQLIECGFVREDVSSEESGGDVFFYYIHKIGDLEFITSENDTNPNGEFDIYFFNYNQIKISDIEDWKILSNVLELNVVDE